MHDADHLVVCVLDNDPSQLELKKRALSSAGWRTQPFSDPDAFLKYAGTHFPDFAILGFGGPRAGGLQVRARLREISPATRAIFALKSHLNPARDVLPENELVNLIKQYVRTSERRVFSKRFLSKKREVGLGICA
jgi:response regulator RpfG family c-di-GMP phosphodiesterase